MLLLGLAVVPAAVPAPEGGVAAVKIAVSARGATPKLAHARVAQSVTWTNATASPHRVDPKGRGFAAFVLHAHGRHTVRFKAPGRYNYRVDRRLAAAVIVRARGSATPGTGKPPLLRTWSGTFHSDAASNGGAGYQACSTSWAGSLRFTASSSGAAGGTGTADEVPGTAVCALAVDPQRSTSVSFTVHGAVTRSDVSLTFTLTAIRGGGGGDGSGFITHLAYQPTIDLPIDASGRVHGTADFSYPFGNGGTITAHDRLDLTGS